MTNFAIQNHVNFGTIYTSLSNSARTQKNRFTTWAAGHWKNAHDSLPAMTACAKQHIFSGMSHGKTWAWNHFSVKKATVVCDRAMAGRKNVAALQAAGFFFVLACKLRQLTEELYVNDLSVFTKLNENGEDGVLFRGITRLEFENKSSQLP